MTTKYYTLSAGGLAYALSYDDGDDCALTIANEHGAVDVELVSGTDLGGGSYAAGSVVRLVAHADEGYTFTGFSGDLTSTLNLQTVVVDSDKSVTASFASIIGSYESINTAWLASEGSAPYYLDSANTTYTLHQDVSSDGTCFALLASGITLDLNGYTITYDNATPISVAGANGSFESDGSGWDFSGAAQASVQSGTYIQPATVFHGSKALRFTTPCSNQYVATSAQVALAANTTYQLSLSVYNRVSSAITLYGELAGTAVRAEDAGLSSRGFEWEGATAYKTGGSPESYTVNVGISGAAAVASGYCYADYVKITRFTQHGVLVHPKSTLDTAHADIIRTGSSPNATVKNGRITQGQDSGYRCHGIYSRSGANGSAFYNLTITVSGDGSSAICTDDVDQMVIRDNVITSTSIAVDDRDALPATVQLDECNGVQIYNNTIYGAPCTALRVQGQMDGETPSVIHDNYIAVSSRYTNGSCIFLRNDSGTQVYDNTLNGGSSSSSDDNYGGFGINYYGEVGGSKVYGNTITVRARQNSQEYDALGGYEYDGMCGIHLRDGSSPPVTMDDVEIYNNTITSYGVGWESHCVRLRRYCTNINIHDNTLTAMHSSGQTFHLANIFRFAGDATDNLDGDADSITIANNTIATNGKLLMGYAITNITLDSNSFEVLSGADDPNYLVVALRNPANETIDNLVFLNQTYVNPASRTAIVAMDVVDTAAPPVAATYASFTHSYTLSITVRDGSAAPVSGATVVVTDKDDATVFTDTTDANGVAGPVHLAELVNDGGAVTTATPYTVTATLGSSVATEDVYMDEETAITMILGA